MDHIYSRVANSLNTKLKELFGEQNGFLKEDLEQSVIPLIEKYHKYHNIILWDINLFDIRDDQGLSGGIYYTITAQQPIPDDEKDTYSSHSRNVYLLELVKHLGKSHHISHINFNDITPDVVQVTFKLNKDLNID